jgi:predicted TIM-barrel fold metal-dependent hydrolase
MRRGYRDIPPAMVDAKARLAFMDEEKIWANVIYPNVAGFGAGGFLRLGDPELMLECVRAYNDFLLEWCSADPRRLVPVMATPFWDVAAAVREIQRCAARGYRAVIFCNQPQDHGAPVLRDRHWTRSGRRPRKRGCRSASTSAAAASPTRSRTPPTSA